MYPNNQDPGEAELEADDRARREEEEAARRHIVKVRYGSEGTEGREYSYYSEEALQVGDLVEVPLKNGITKARVTVIGVSEAEVASFKDSMRTIPAGSLRAVETPPDFPDPNAWRTGEEEVCTCPGGPESSVLFTDRDCPLHGRRIRPSAAEVEPAQQALINIAPEKNIAIQALYKEGLNLLGYAERRVIKSDEDAKLATEDRAIIAGLRKKLEELRAEYTGPINAHLAAFRDTFNRFVQPLLDADNINKEKWGAYRAAVAAAARKAEETNRMAEEVARRQAEASGTGEITVVTTPVEVPKAAATLRTGLGTSSAYNLPKYRVVDFKLLPDEYKLPDAGKLTRVIKAAKGQITIAGVEIWFEETQAIRPKYG